VFIPVEYAPSKLLVSVIPSVVVVPLVFLKPPALAPLVAPETFIPFQPAAVTGLLLVLKLTCTTSAFRPFTVIVKLSDTLPPKTSVAVIFTPFQLPRLVLFGFMVSVAVPLWLSASAAKAGRLSDEYVIAAPALLLDALRLTTTVVS